MDNQQHRTEITQLGEFGLIRKIKSLANQNIDTIKGIGDDAAVFKVNRENVLVSTDFLIENIHFDLTYTPLKHLGYKAAIVNFSDIYAMNGTPKHITVSIAISNRFSVEAIETLYSGIQLACEKHGVDIIGGDTTSSEKGLIISITVIGEANQKDIVYRNGAKPGDLIAVTGNLGAAYMGLHILQREKAVFIANPEMQPEIDTNNAYLVERFLKPENPRSFIQFINNEDIKLTSMMDVSDGLSSELLHIAEQSNVGFEVFEAQIPIHSNTLALAEQFNMDPTTCALNGGEDYELLFTFDPAFESNFESFEGITIIGSIKPKDFGTKLHSKGKNLYDIKAQGWKSF